MEALAVACKLGDAKRRPTHTVAKGGLQEWDNVDPRDGEVVELQVLPPMQPVVQMDKMKRITSIDGVELETLTTSGLRELAHDTANKSIEKEHKAD